eukprot:2289210-Amphidinium_carterae.2
MPTAVGRWERHLHLQKSAPQNGCRLLQPYFVIGIRHSSTSVCSPPSTQETPTQSGGHRTATHREGTFRKVELKGPSDVLAWMESFKLLRTALVSLSAVRPAGMDRYSDHILNLPRLYGSQLCVDIRCGCPYAPRTLRAAEER